MCPIATYLATLRQTLLNLPQSDIDRAVETLMQAHAESRRIFVMGNGGSAAMASHFACDLIKGAAQAGKPRFKVFSLSDNLSVLTAYGNDFGYETVFAEPLIALSEPGDVAVIISSSGNSPNILSAAEAAKKRDLITIGITGFEGGKLKDKVDVCVVVPADTKHPDGMQLVEDGQGVILHTIFVAIRCALKVS